MKYIGPAQDQTILSRTRTEGLIRKVYCTIVEKGLPVVLNGDLIEAYATRSEIKRAGPAAEKFKLGVSDAISLECILKYVHDSRRIRGPYVLLPVMLR